MLDLYTILLSVHIIAAIIWIGGGFSLMLLLARMRREQDPAALSGLLRHGAVLGQRIFGPASLLLVIVGFGLVADGDWDFKLWLILGIVGWLGSAVHGAAFMGPKSEKLSELVASGTGDAQTIDARLRNLALHGNAELVVLLLVVVDMVVKPGT